MAAKLLHPLLFCNDINLKTLINIVTYDDQHLLITCKSFIKRFNLNDRKQVNSWITKSWHPFTGGAVKDPKSDHIYAIINYSSLCQWSVEEKDIENIKKHSGWLKDKVGLMPQIPNNTWWNSQEACVDTFIKNFHKYMEINTEQEIDGKIATALSNAGLYREALHLQKHLKEVAIALDKFKSQIKALIPSKDFTYIIYSCGFVECLDTALKRRKEVKKQIIWEDEDILHFQVFEKKKEAALLGQNKKGKIFLYKFNIGSYKDPVRVKIKLGDYSLTGSSIFTSGKLLTTWSDGNLYCLNILEKELSSGPGDLKGRLSALKATKKIKILELASNHIALQGMNVNLEGGIVLLWDTKFGVSVSSKPMKMYRDPPLAWSFGSGIVVGDGGSLVYIPVSLSPSTVASIFGSRRSENIDSYDECVSWNSFLTEGDESKKEILSATQTIFSNKSTELAAVIRNLHQGSTSEDIIVNLLVSNLIEHQNVKLLSECLSAFSFVPEKSLVSILKFLVELPEERFPTITNRPSINKEKKLKTEEKCKTKKKPSPKPPEVKNEFDSEDNVERNALDSFLMIGLKEEQRSSAKKEVSSPFSVSKSSAINEVLVNPFTITELSSAMHILDFSSSLSILDYLHYLLASGEAKILEDKNSKVVTIEKASVWFSLLLDTNYHQLVMTSEVEVHRKLLTCFSDITSLYDFLEASFSIDTLVERVLSSKPLPTTQADSPYSIERLIL